MKKSALVALSIPVLATVLLAGCATPDPVSPSDPGSSPGAGESSAVELVGMWRVSDAEGETAETWLRLDAHDFMLWRDCGPIYGSWTAGEQLFLAGVHGANSECVTDNTIPEVPWLEAVASYRASVGGWELLDAAGTVQASLTIDGQPAPHPDVIADLTEPPVVTDETRELFRAAAPLPADLTSVSASDLPGRWNPIGDGEGTDAHVEFASDGRYGGSDGCNGSMGRWAVGAAGELLATSGPSTLMWCEGAPVPLWVSQAKRAGFDGAQLVLFDVEGAELGRLARA